MYLKERKAEVFLGPFQPVPLGFLGQARIILLLECFSLLEVEFTGSIMTDEFMTELSNKAKLNTECRSGPRTLTCSEVL